jgi:hypothetical protein
MPNLQDNNYRPLRASAMMVEAHWGQFRDDGKIPYHTHPFRVAEAVTQALAGANVPPGLFDPYSVHDMIVAALVHDVIEDAGDPVFWSSRIRDELGASVLSLTQALTNPSKNLPPGTARHKKKALDREHYEGDTVPLAARFIKLFDRADNLSEMESWGPQRVRQYLVESDPLIRAIVNGVLNTPQYMANVEAGHKVFVPAIHAVDDALIAAWDRVTATGVVFPRDKPEAGDTIWFRQPGGATHKPYANYAVFVAHTEEGNYQTHTGVVVAPAFPTLEAIQKVCPDLARSRAEAHIPEKGGVFGT